MASVCDQAPTNVKAVNQLINPDFDKSIWNEAAKKWWSSAHFAFWKYALCMLSKMQFIEVIDISKVGAAKKTARKQKDVGKNEKESKRTKVIQNWYSTIEGYIELSKRCLNLDITEISLRYLKIMFNSLFHDYLNSISAAKFVMHYTSTCTKGILFKADLMLFSPNNS